MMFNGLLCADSDTSDFSKESIGGFSGVDSGSGSCDTRARAHYYHNKLLSIMQILENKEETVRIQSESLAVAEGRLAALTGRVADLRKEIDRKDRELQTLRKSSGSRVDKTDVSISTHFQEMDNQKNIVNTLQNNLCIIEDLYRESFYETVKQEGLIDMLRKSYLDVRLTEREKDDQIGRLQSVINTQRWSLDQCQNVAMEVENLKLEISNFLNSSNNDSGMWERSEGSVECGLGDDLHDIADHLLRLRDMLEGDCICGLQEENMKLKHTNEMMEIQMNELRQRMSSMESLLLDKDDIDRQYKEQIEFKEKELHTIRQQLAAVETSSRDQTTMCDTLSVQLQQARVLLDDRTAELLHVQQRCEIQDLTVKELKEQLDRADMIIKENCSVRWPAWRAHGERAHADAACGYARTRRAARSLCAGVRAARAGGAALRAAAGGARACVERARGLLREREEKIREKELLLCSLQERLQPRRNDMNTRSSSENEPSCSRCMPVQECGLRDTTSCCTSKARERRDIRTRTSANEEASCSSAPVPPRRTRKMPPCGDRHCEWFVSARGVRGACGGGGQPPAPPAPAPAHCHHHENLLHMRYLPRSVSPCGELRGRVRGLGEALAAARRRRAPPPPHPHPPCDTTHYCTEF